jgi:hypothetical protein
MVDRQGSQENAIKLRACAGCSSGLFATSIRAIFELCPGSSPFFTPGKWSGALHTDFDGKIVGIAKTAT